MTFRPLIPLVLASAVLAALPLSAHAQARPAAAAKPAAAAATTQGSPSKLVLDNSQRILTTLDSRRAEFTADRGKLQAFIAGEFDQMFDREYSARQVLGRHGRGADDAEVKVFADALADSLMRRYGSSLLDFNTRLRVRVKSETPLPRGLGVKVSSEMLRQGGEPIPVDYLMRQTADGWRVFDVMVEGVSFVQTFRQQFDTPLSRKPIRDVAADLRAGRIQADAGN